ncbi:hypothetical protein MZD54_13305, partial [Escherichia coli]|nr:hypothetical protein [Escherichia coli]
ADRNRSHWSTSKTPSYTKSVSWQHHPPYKGEFISSYSLSCRYLFQFVTINMAKILQQTAVKKFGEDFL